MKRRDFFKRFGTVAVAAVAAPVVAKEIMEMVPTEPLHDTEWEEVEVNRELRQYPLRPDECYMGDIAERVDLLNSWPAEDGYRLEIVTKYPVRFGDRVLVDKRCSNSVNDVICVVGGPFGLTWHEGIYTCVLTPINMDVKFHDGLKEGQYIVPLKPFPTLTFDSRQNME